MMTSQTQHAEQKQKATSQRQEPVRDRPKPLAEGSATGHID